MRAAAHLEATIEILTALERGSRGTDRVVHDDLVRRRYAGSGDRRAITELLYACLRRRAVARWRFALLGADVTPRIEAFAGWMALKGAGVSDLAELIASGGPHAPAPPNTGEAALLAALTQLPEPTPPAWVQAGVPDWTMPHFARRFGAEAEAEAGALNAAAAFDLRVNTLRSKSVDPVLARAEALQLLAGEGISAALTPLSPIGLRIAEPRALTRSKAFRSGLIEIQDEGSQLVAAAVGARPGETVIDYCAGAGGKTLALAAAMENRGRLIACDTDAGRLDRLAERARRAGAQVEPRVLADQQSLGDLKGTADRVLVDAPCSGSGAWRRDPAARWHLTPARLAELMELQNRVLSDATSLVSPGGTLIYATCSLFVEEDEDRISAFLRGATRFRREDCHVGPGGGPDLLTTPRRHGCDGFFASILRASP